MSERDRPPSVSEAGGSARKAHKSKRGWLSSSSESERDRPPSVSEAGGSARKAHKRESGSRSSVSEAGGSTREAHQPESGPPSCVSEAGGSARKAHERDRGQLVLVAAAVVAVALIPVVIAYTQLGYSGIATTEPTATTPEADAVDALERAAFEVATDRQGDSPWANRSAVASAVGSDVAERADAIETSDLEGARIHEVERNATAASDWADEHCPAGPSRQFGPCAAAAGVVLQERAGDVHVLAIAVDLRTVTEDGVYRGTYVLDAELGDGRGVGE